MRNILLKKRWFRLISRNFWGLFNFWHIHSCKIWNFNSVSWFLLFRSKSWKLEVLASLTLATVFKAFSIASTIFSRDVLLQASSRSRSAENNFHFVGKNFQKEKTCWILTDQWRRSRKIFRQIDPVFLFQIRTTDFHIWHSVEYFDSFDFT